MTQASSLLPLGVILAMAGVTYLCRAGGYWAMGRLPLTPRLERALRALPGCIIVATVVPIAARIGAPALVALTAAVAAMLWRRVEVLALAAGLGAAALWRAAL